VIDGEIRRLLNEAHERVRQTLERERAALERVAHHLIAREVIDRAEFLATIDGRAGSIPPDATAGAPAGDAPAAPPPPAAPQPAVSVEGGAIGA